MKALVSSMHLVEQSVLRFEIEVGVKLVVAGALFRERRAGPIHFEERTGDVGDAEVVFLENLDGVGDLLLIERGDVLVPHAAQLDPLEAEILGGYLAGVVEVGRDFVVDDGEAEWAGRRYGMAGGVRMGGERKLRSHACGCQSTEKIATRDSHGRLHSQIRKPL